MGLPAPWRCSTPAEGALRSYRIDASRSHFEGSLSNQYGFDKRQGRHLPIRRRQRPPHYTKRANEIKALSSMPHCQPIIRPIIRRALGMCRRPWFPLRSPRYIRPGIIRLGRRHPRLSRSKTQSIAATTLPASGPTRPRRGGFRGGVRYRLGLEPPGPRMRRPKDLAALDVSSYFRRRRRGARHHRSV